MQLIGALSAAGRAEGAAYVQVLARGGDPKVALVDGAGKQAAKLP